MIKKYSLAIVGCLALGYLAGCLMTGTVVITTSLVPDSEGNEITITDQYFDEAELETNLNDNSTFADYKDDISNVDNIGFYISARNDGNTDAVFQLFLEPDTSENYESDKEMVDSLADIILTDLVIPAGQHVTIDWNESMNYVTNLDYFKEVLEGGVFSLYPAALPRDNFNITIDSLVVIVTLTGKK